MERAAPLVGLLALTSALAYVAWRSQVFLKKKLNLSSASNDLDATTAEIPANLVDLIGRTPLVRIPSLSALTGCEILGKCEYMNPFGSSKDRVALQTVRYHEQNGTLQPGGTLIEGTSGSTGVSLARVARILGYRAVVVIPDDMAQEKIDLLKRYGAEIVIVRPVSYSNPNHYVHTAKALADATPGGVFVNQFESIDANYRAHLETTGPEILSALRRAGLTPNALVASSGTGGTIAGVSTCLRASFPEMRVVLADPQGSSLYNAARHRVAYTAEMAETKLKRHRVDTIVVEGVGLDRLTANFELALPHLDDAVRVTDPEVCCMARKLLREDSLFLGSSSAVNCVAAMKTALALGPGNVIVTILPSSGEREVSKLYSDEYCESLLGGTSFDWA